MVQYVRDDDGEEAEEQQCSAGVNHRVEHPSRDGRGVGKVRHLLGKKSPLQVRFNRVDAGFS